MAFNIVSAFDPKKLRDSRYSRIFNLLENKGVDINVLPDADPKNLDCILSAYKPCLDQADMIFHMPEFIRNQLFLAYENDFRSWEMDRESKGLHWSSDEYDSLQAERIKKEEDFQRQLNEHIQRLGFNGVILDADVYLQHTGVLYSILKDLRIPTINRMSVEQWESGKFFPVVFKMGCLSQGHGIHFIENDDQFRKMFDPEYLIRDDGYGSGRFSDGKSSFNVSGFIQCPSDHFTHYRVFTLGDGTILGAALSYSSVRKSQDERIAFDDRVIYNVFDDVKSPLFLNRKKIVSNKSNGGTQIPLSPTEDSRQITSYEQGILEEHGITDGQIPSRLADQAYRTAKCCGKYGLYILGQDWIQGTDGVFYFLEANQGPQLGIFDTLYNKGLGIDKQTFKIATEKIAEGIFSHLNKAMTGAR
jgi:hypothetical protein